MKKRILGLDTGTNSLGWAVVDSDEYGNCNLVKCGDLIFQEGVKIEKGIELSKASERSGHRAAQDRGFESSDKAWPVPLSQRRAVARLACAQDIPQD